MSYREDERKKAIKIREALFRDPGAGIFYKKERDFVLKDPERYIVISPEKFIKPSSVCPDTQSIIIYLEKRYWNEIYC